MKPRMSVARCCCPRPGTPPQPPITITAVEYGWWIIQNTADPVFVYRDQDNGNISYGSGVDSSFTPPGQAFNYSGFFTFERDIPQGTVIQSATVDMGAPIGGGPGDQEPLDSWNTLNPNLSLDVLPQSNVYAACLGKCEDVDDVQLLPFGFTGSQMNNKVRTAAETGYPLEWWRGQGTLQLLYSLSPGETYQDLDITQPLQECVDRPGWNSQYVRIFMDWDPVRGPHVPINIDNEVCGAVATPQWTGNRPVLTLTLA